MTMVADDPITAEREVQIALALAEIQCDAEWFRRLDDEEKQRYLGEHVRGRYDIVRRWCIPWIKHAVDLKQCRVVEIGCGTGSTAAALAIEARSLDSYDIVSQAVTMARKRAEIIGCTNVTFHCHPPERLLEELRNAHPPGTVDVVVCFAMLEHATHRERQATLRTAWESLAPGGHLVVADTPNRLSYWDGHTTWLPFFECLPHEVAVDYFDRSTRTGHVKSVRIAAERSLEAAVEQLTRLGRGVSYHDFELAIGDVHALVVGDGFDPEPLAYYGVSPETRCMVSYAAARRLGIHPGFLRSTIDVILRKPGGRNPKPQRPRDLEGIVRPFSATPDWRLAVAGKSRATLFRSSSEPVVLKVQFDATPDPESWSVQLVSRPRVVRKDRRYAVKLLARADAVRDVSVTLKHARTPWENVGLSERIRLVPEWTPFSFEVLARTDSDEALLCVEVGGSSLSVEVSEVSIEDL